MSKEDADDLVDELIDRYGDLPDDAMSLIKVAEIRSHAEVTGIENISIRDRRFVLKLADVNRINAYAMVMAKDVLADDLVISSGKTSGLSLYTGKLPDVDKLLLLMRTLREAIGGENAI